MSAVAASARAMSRPLMPIRAPNRASPTAVALPIPPVPPVTRTVLPTIRGVSVSVMAASTAVDVGLETLDEEPRWQADFKEDPGNREHEADMDAEDFSDHSHHETHVANQAANRQE